MAELGVMSTRDLLALHARIASELRDRKITRSSNNPVGDYAEYLFSNALGWSLANNSTGSYDALDAAGLRYQIKSRRLTPHNNSTLLGVMRDLPKQGFDVLAVVIFDETYRVKNAALLPHSALGALCRYSEHQRGWLLTFKPVYCQLADAVDVTSALVAAQEAL